MTWCHCEWSGTLAVASYLGSVDGECVVVRSVVGCGEVCAASGMCLVASILSLCVGSTAADEEYDVLHK